MNKLSFKFNFKFKIPQLLGLFFSGCIIYYLSYLKTIGCFCAMNDKRTYIYFYTWFIIFFNIFAMSSYYSISFLRKYLLITYVLIMASILNIIFTLQYIEELKKNNCNCSKSIIRDIMFIVSTIRLFVWIILFLLIFVLFYSNK